MNKRQKKQLADKFAVLYQVHSMLSANGIIMEQLENCQEFAIEIGTQIDRLAGEGTKAVSLLEAYCEKVYLAGVAEEKHERAMNIKAMEKLAKEAEKSLWYDIPCGKKEIVFFPYKASMWDSLESIYLAAKEDQQCECYVVPIPYFDRNSDGTIGQMHYEGGDLPKDIPVVDWKEYDVVVHKPDVAYIHNPYDGQNYVTTIHPQYYAKELKKHVGKLIYCPYFVSGEILDCKYATLPGVLWADKVMVQSEHIREQYIQYYDEVIVDESVRAVLGCGRDKFVALGSPKVDKVKFGNKQEVVLPEEWQTLCKDKKIVFYNTHLSEALVQGENFLQKLKSVLSFFEKNEELVLWWRPHPLSEETMAALKPEILKAYKDIVKTYQDKKYGIYDDTPLWHRAVLWADLYYGSRGSLLPLFGVTGKPVILQKTDMVIEKSTKETNPVSYEVFVPDGKRIYFLSSQLGALVSLDIETEEWILEADLPLELQDEISFCSRMYIWRDKIYIFVANANAHFVYDKKEKTFQKVSWNIGNLRPMSNTQIKFADVLNYNQYYIMMSHKFDTILVYNRECGEMVCHTEWIEELRKRISNFQKGEFYFRLRSTCVVQENVFAVLRRDKIDVICQFSLTDMKLVQAQEVPFDGVLQCMEHDGESLWMIQDFGKNLVQWDYVRNQWKSYRNPTISGSVQGLQYRLLILDKQIILYPIKKGRKCLTLKEGTLVEISQVCHRYQNCMVVTEYEAYGISLEDETLVVMDAHWKLQKEIFLDWPVGYKDEEEKDRVARVKLEALFNDSDMKYLVDNGVIQFRDWFQILSQETMRNWKWELLEKKYTKLFYIAEKSAGSFIHDYVLKQLED